MKEKLTYKLILLILSVIIQGAGGVSAQEIRYNGSGQFASGSYYFTEQTGSFYLNNGFSFSQNGYRISASYPFIYQSTPWISYTGTSGGLIPTGGPNNGRFDRGSDSSSGMGMGQGSGHGGNKIDPGSKDSVLYDQTSFGDPSLSIQYPIYNPPLGSTIISGDLALKIPLTDPNSGYGTGAWDVGAGLSILRRIDRYLILLSGSYWMMGDMDELNFYNIFSYSAAIGRSFSNGKFLSSASLFGSTRIIDQVDPPFSFGGSFGWQVNSMLNLNTNFMIGLSESSSDYSFGIGWSVIL
ncbi:hypothetical protein AB2B38_002625 [Balneola sp. MJW-20]|uniref:hypothetical protein n=1 Tax=Gracilimonas aurantiaca TaxID=3234185 RepID=UPI0034678FB3